MVQPLNFIFTRPSQAAEGGNWELQLLPAVAWQNRLTTERQRLAEGQLGHSASKEEPVAEGAERK